LFAPYIFKLSSSIVMQIAVEKKELSDIVEGWWYKITTVAFAEWLQIVLCAIVLWLLNRNSL